MGIEDIIIDCWNDESPDEFIFDTDDDMSQLDGIYEMSTSEWNKIVIKIQEECIEGCSCWFT